MSDDTFAKQCAIAIRIIERALVRSDEREKLMERFRVQNDLAMQDLRRRLLSEDQKL